MFRSDDSMPVLGYNEPSSSKTFSFDSIMLVNEEYNGENNSITQRIRNERITWKCK